MESFPRFAWTGHVHGWLPIGSDKPTSRYGSEQLTASLHMLLRFECRTEGWSGLLIERRRVHTRHKPGIDRTRAERLVVGIEVVLDRLAGRHWIGCVIHNCLEHGSHGLSDLGVHLTPISESNAVCTVFDLVMRSSLVPPLQACHQWPSS